MRKGTVRVDFAGTHEERIAYVKAHSTEFPNGLHGGHANRERGDELPVVSARFNSEAELAAILQAFATLGWTDDDNPPAVTFHKTGGRKESAR